MVEGSGLRQGQRRVLAGVAGAAMALLGVVGAGDCQKHIQGQLEPLPSKPLQISLVFPLRHEPKITVVIIGPDKVCKRNRHTWPERLNAVPPPNRDKQHLAWVNNEIGKLYLMLPRDLRR